METSVARERLITGEAQLEDEGAPSLRPDSLTEYIGQLEVVRPLHIALEAARQRAEPLEHVLLHGPPGLGKTTLAHIIRRHMDVNIVAASGPALKRAGDLMGLLTNLKQGDVFFIDEIHRLDPAIEEYLYPAMEDFVVDFVVDRGASARMLNFKLRRFTLVGATTMAGLLTAPLRDRFGLVYRLNYYSPEDLRAVVLRSARLLEIGIGEDAASEIARRARGTPRVANRLLRRVRDYAQVEADGEITHAVVDAALRLEGIDEAGLDALDRALLRTIIDVYQGGPVGIEALAATLNETQSTLVEVVEPYLLQIGFLARTPGGRKATLAAYQHLHVPPGTAPGQPSLGL
ncbi:MAG: Holliday junction branch migration DNA helicase RuvB [Armatimonadetes bacterium]|nr:Holliday junction branch migration DNA helicase RuvB [Armatimonadota bacterium]